MILSELLFFSIFLFSHFSVTLHTFHTFKGIFFRGELGSYPPEEIVARAIQSFQEVLTIDMFYIPFCMSLK